MEVIAAPQSNLGSVMRAAVVPAKGGRDVNKQVELKCMEYGRALMARVAGGSSVEEPSWARGVVDGCR